MTPEDTSIEETPHADVDDRRRYERLPVALPVTIRYRGRLIPATALNLSCGGALLDADAPMATEQSSVEIVVDLSALERDVSLRGEIVRRDQADGTVKLGVKFTNLFTIGHDAILRYLKRHGIH